MSTKPNESEVAAPVAELTLCDEEVQNLTAAATRDDWPSPISSPRGFANAARLGGLEALTTSTIFDLQTFSSASRAGTPVMLVSGLQMPDLPRTPTHARDGLIQAEVPARLFAMIAQQVGEIYALRGEGQDRVAHTVVPNPLTPRSQISSSYEVTLEPHVENGWCDYRPDFVALGCLRQRLSSSAGTLVASVEQALSLMAAEDIELLRAPLFRMKVDDSILGSRSDLSYREGLPCLVGRERALRARVDFAETEGMDPQASGALDRFLAVVRMLCRPLHLQPGQLAIIDNHRAFHGRHPFVPQFDGMDRWLMRMYVTRTLGWFAADERLVVEPL